MFLKLNLSVTMGTNKWLFGSAIQLHCSDILLNNVVCHTGHFPIAVSGVRFPLLLHKLDALGNVGMLCG